jgi:hypothetical protein
MCRRHFLALFALLSVTLLSACGGKANGSSQTPGEGAGSASPPGAVLDRIDLAQSAATLDKLKSFRFDMSMKIDVPSSGASTGDDLGAAVFGLLGALGDIKASGALVTPDQAEVHMTLFGQEFGYVQIGDRAWEKTSGKWTATTPDGSFEMKPGDLFDGFIPAEVLKGAKTSSERVNGVQTTHYSFDKKALESMLKDLGDQADFSQVDRAAFDIWLDVDNVPVKMTMDIAGVSQGQAIGLKVEMNIRDINDPSIEIKPPV